MNSGPVRFLRGRSAGIARSLAMLVGSTVACSGVGAITGGPGSATGGRTTGTGSGAGGTLGVGPIDPGSTSSPGWYDTLKVADCAAPATSLPSSRIWRLSSTQWTNTVAQALNVAAPDVSTFPQDQIDPRTGYSDDSMGDKVTLPLASAYFDKTDAVATQAAAGAIKAIPCLGTAPITVACGQMFASTYGPRLFRRALTAPEIMSYASYLNGESTLDPPATAVASALKALMLSPNFIYRTELGDSKPGAVELTTDEIASLLSYSIADMPPDAPLRAIAAQLTDPAVRTAQAERLAALPAAQDKLLGFWREYLALGGPPTTAGIDRSTYDEATTFFSKIVFENTGSLRDLLTAPYTYADATVAAVYGSAQPSADGKLMLDPTQRSGFLTSVAMLSQTAAPSQAATVIHRGLLVRERVLCQIPPPPPANVVPDPAQIQMAGSNATARQNYQLFATTHTACNACHSFFQPLGLAFEAYAANGQFRTQYPAPISMPIDTTGTLDSAGDATGAFNDVVGMAAKLGGSQMAQYCMAQQFAEYAFGRAVSIDQEACMVRSMGDYVTSKGGQMRALLASFAATPTATRRFHQ
jgi:hypothetical protein